MVFVTCMYMHVYFADGPREDSAPDRGHSAELLRVPAGQRRWGRSPSAVAPADPKPGQLAPSPGSHLPH